MPERGNMDLINQKDIFTSYTEVAKYRKRYSNFYFTMQEFADKWKAHKFKAYQTETVFLIIEEKQSFHYLYYMCDSWEWIEDIQELKQQFPKLVVSIVGKKENEMYKSFLQYGYSVYKIYQRMRKIASGEEIARGTYVEYCSMQDKDRIKDLMLGTFDDVSDHIPDDEELKIFLEHRAIICIRENGKIIGFIIFEDKGKTSYIRMICIDHQFRGQGFGSCLLRTYFMIHCGCQSYTLWYDVNNFPAYSLYQKWGYQQENLYNYIFVL